MKKSEHILIPRIESQLREGAIDRREFIRMATLLGVSAGVAYATAGLASPAMAAETLPFPAPDPEARPGGILRMGQQVAKMDDPAIFNWNEMSNQARPILEQMTMVGPDNIVRPMLVESWTPSDDLMTWTLNVRKGVTWHNGEELTAEHLAWNILRWTDSATASVALGLSTFAALSAPASEGGDSGAPEARKPIPNAVQVIDTYTLKLNLSKPILSVAEDCAEFTTLIAHPSLKQPFSDNPIGTGPYTLAELKVGERCILKRITKTPDGKNLKYWGGDVFLEEIHFYHFDQNNQAAALASGSVDAIYELAVDQIDLARTIEGAQIRSVETAATLCCRMQVDQKPFDDIRVRQAIVKSVDNAAIKALVFPEGGSVSYNYHVSPVHPEYFALPDLVRDVEGAKALLAAAGYGDGIDISIDVGNTDGSWHQAICEAMRDQLKDAGINLTVNIMPTTKFWEIWDKTPFGATSWGHRPLGTMTLAQAYRTGVPWNETHFSDPEFDAALSEVEATIDLDKRKAKMEKIEKILQDAAVMVQPIWRPVYNLASAKVHGYEPHPARQMQLTKAWMET